MIKRYLPLLVVLIALAASITGACTCSYESNGSKSENLALQVLQVVAPSSKCTSLYADTGVTHTYSALCTLPDGSVTYFWLSTDNALKYQSLIGHAPTPTPAPTPVPAVQGSAK